MTDTTTQPRAGDVPTSDDFPAHFHCSICYPEAYPGMRGVCGAELLGIPARPEDPNCQACEAVVAKHVLGHFGGK